LEKKSDYKKAYVRLVHPFPYPTLEEQRKMSAGIAHVPQPKVVPPPATAEEAATQAAQQAEQERLQAEVARQKFEAKERVRKQVEDNLNKLNNMQRDGVRGNR
jgi:hypothetical protein